MRDVESNVNEEDSQKQLALVCRGRFGKPSPHIFVHYRSSGGTASAGRYRRYRCSFKVCSFHQTHVLGSSAICGLYLLLQHVFKLRIVAPMMFRTYAFQGLLLDVDHSASIRFSPIPPSLPSFPPTFPLLFPPSLPLIPPFLPSLHHFPSSSLPPCIPFPAQGPC